MPDSLTSTAIRARLGTRWLGHTLEVYPSIDSTQTRALALARAGAPAGTVVLAEYQSQGRGRLDRRWHAPPGSSLLLSLILRPALAPAQAQRATMICSLAAVRAMAQVAGLAAQIKWPNDLLVHGKKVGGMLTELGARGTALDYVIVGLGLNVNLDVRELPETLTPATSLAAEAGRPIPRLELLVAFLEHLEAYADRLAAGWSPRAEWRGALATLGQMVRVGTTEGVLEGLAEDVDEDGALLVRAADGRLHVILAGDVTLRGTPPRPGAILDEN